MMPDNERDRIRREFFDRAAQGWEERNYSPEQREKVGAMVAALGIEPGRTILDAGCGRGLLLPWLRRAAGSAARLIALDASATMLRGVAEKDAGAWALRAPAENIPLIDEYVDLAISFSAFPHFSDKAAAAREFYRVLKPGGRVFVLHIDGREKINRHHDRHRDVAGDHLPCPDGMRAIFGAAGFSEIKLDETEEHYCFSAVK